MKLRELLAGIETVHLTGEVEVEITAAAYDSRQVRPGAVFFAIRGEKTDGNRYIHEAVDRGAVAIASEVPPPVQGKRTAAERSGAAGPPEQVGPLELAESVAWIQVGHARKALARAAANFYSHPAQALRLVGVTGTNGKTTTAFLIDSILRAAGHQSGLFGTILYRTPQATQAATNTTPESLDLQRFLAEARGGGATHAVLEVSSHALGMDRVWSCPFAIAVFTNLTRDHLDFHKTFEEYFVDKMRLFEGTGSGSPAVAVVNVDDPYGGRLVGLAGRTITYGLQSSAEVTTKKFTLSFSGLEFAVETPAGVVKVQSHLVGRMNVYNVLAAIGAGIALGLDREAIEAGIRQLEKVPGRFERIEEGQAYQVVVDYAHTDDALRNLIQTARELNHAGRIITLFGCGGDRDRTKRPMMGEVAGRESDVVVLTSDNPRSEDPLRIINDVVVGLQKAQANYLVEPERGRAIELALDHARPGDTVLLAGKGHETYQVLRDRTIDFDDREVARQVLRQRGYRK